MHGYSQTRHNRSTLAQDGNLAKEIRQLQSSGKLANTIVVFPTYYPQSSVMTDSYYDDGDLTQAFAEHEFIDDLVPAIEGRYSTYAKSTDPADLKASRDHRAFGGFSMGGVTTWAVFANQQDYVKYYLPIAGDDWSVSDDGGSSDSKQTAQRLARAGQGHDFQILAAVGSNDSTRYDMEPQIRAMQKLATFNNKNLEFRTIKGGGHNMTTVKGALNKYAEQLFK